MIGELFTDAVDFMPDISDEFEGEGMAREGD